MATVNDTATVTLQANGQQAAETLDRLKKRAENLRDAIAEAGKAGDKVTMGKLQKELRQTTNDMRKIQSATASAEQVLRRLDKATPKELNSTLRQLKQQLQNVERDSEAWNAQVEKIRQVKAEIARVNQQMEIMHQNRSIIDRINAGWQRFQTVILGAVGAFTGLVMTGRSAVKQFAEMEAEMANVRKFTGMTEEEVERLNEEFRKMDTRTSREELNKLAQEAGRLGKQSIEDVMGFVRAADVINVALDDLGEGATLTLSKLTNIFGDEDIYGTEQAMLKVGSVINELSQNCTASAPYLAQFAQRLAGVGAQAGMTVPQIMAFGAVLDSQGQQVELSATAMSKLVTDLFKNTGKIAKATGMDVEKFSAAIKRSTNEGLLMLLDRLHELGDMSVLADIFKDMGEDGSRATGVLAALAGNVEMLREQQKAANMAFAEGTSVQKEYEVQNNTVQAGLDKARKKFNELAVALGQKLAPVMKYAISGASTMVKVLDAIVTFIGENISAIAMLTASITAYTLAVNAATIATKAQHARMVVTSALSASYTSVVKGLTAAKIALEMIMAKLNRNWAKQSSLMLDARAAGVSLATGYGILLAATTALVGGIIMLVRHHQKQKEAAEKARREYEEYSRSLRDVSKESSALAANETAKLNMLYEAAINEAKSKDERTAAAKRLLDVYPDYFEKMTAEDIMVGKAKEQYEKLTAAVINSARARAAAAKIEENQGKLLELEDTKKRQESDLLNAGIEEGKAKTKYEETKSEGWGRNSYEAGMGAPTDRNIAQADYKNAIKANDAAQAALDETVRQIADIEAANKELAEKYGSATILATLEGGKGNNNGGNTAPDEKELKKIHDREKEEDEAWRATQEAIALASYAKGETDYIEYQDRLLCIKEEFTKKRLERTSLDEKERGELEKQAIETQLSQNEATQKLMREDVEAQYTERKAVITQQYADGLLSREAYDVAIRRTEIEHLKRLTEIEDEGSKEQIEAQKKLGETLLADQVANRKKAEEAEKKHQQEMEKVRDNAFSSVHADAGYQQELSILQQVYAQELEACQNNAERKLKVEEAYQMALMALRQKWSAKGSDMAQQDAASTMGAFRSGIQQSVEWLNSDGGQAVQGALSTLTQGMGELFSGISSLVEAELEIECAAIEKRYEAEISAAEGNQHKVKQIEEKKQKEEAAAKAKASKKQFAMQVIQAVAQTAQGAISAYSSAAAIPVVGFVMAPIAAAMAVAAGMLQVATIKKQQQAAAATGYAEGGFTPEGGKWQEKGTVHAGEWVASQKLTHNKQVRPLLEALDYMQHSNTMAQMPLAGQQQPTIVVQTPTVQAPAYQPTDLSGLTDTIGRLNNRLSEPFVTVNTISGDGGIKEAQDEYDRLIRNKTPRSRRAK